jgi:hypothetical protein
MRVREKRAEDGGVSTGIIATQLRRLGVAAPPWLINLSTLLAGGCAALEFAPRPRVKVAMLGSMVLLAEYFAGVDASPDIKTPLFFAAGALAGGLIIPLSFAAVVAGRGSRWLHIGLRIVGS